MFGKLVLIGTIDLFTFSLDNNWFFEIYEINPEAPTIKISFYYL